MEWVIFIISYIVIATFLLLLLKGAHLHDSDKNDSQGGPDK